MLASFAELLSPVSPEAFFADFHGRQPLHIRGGAERFVGLMSWPALSELLNRTGLWTARSLELVSNGQKLPPQEFCRPGVDRDMRQNLIVVAQRVAHWLRQGVSLVANDV